MEKLAHSCKMATLLHYPRTQKIKIQRLALGPFLAQSLKAYIFNILHIIFYILGLLYKSPPATTTPVAE